MHDLVVVGINDEAIINAEKLTTFGDPTRSIVGENSRTSNISFRNFENRPYTRVLYNNS